MSQIGLSDAITAIFGSVERYSVWREEEDEALNETQKKKKKVFSMLAEQYAASKCTVY